MSKRNLYLAGIFILFTVLAAIGFSQANKVRNIEATLWPPDYEAASALIAEGGCADCHKMPAIDGANGTLWPSLYKPAKEFQEGEKNLEFIVESIVDPAVDGDDEYKPTVMPTNFGTTFTPTEITTIATFVATMNCE